ncbi:hypothetical protein BD413DRAFT_640429 [Trametes elegans]|nr:hypothetical protein BD413DRAFT_640429 [Trametes elegans]
MHAWAVSVLTGAGADTAPALVVDFGTAKYVLNAGEGTGRAWLGSQHSFRKTKGVFVTAPDTARCGGLPGLMMLCADATIPKLEIVGPHGLMHYLATMRGFTYRSTMVVKAIEAPATPVQSLPSGPNPPPPVFQDESLTVYAIPIFPSTQLDTNNSDAGPSQDLTERPLKRKRTPSPPRSPARRKSPPASEYTFGSSTPAPATLESTAPVPVALATRSQLPSFNPSQLRGTDAQEWRKLMLQEMFPMREAPAPERGAPNQSKQEKARVAQAQVRKTTSGVQDGAAGGARAAWQTAPDKRHARLPRLAGERDAPVAPPTLAYLLVGPSVRGKFDVKKAEALGLPRGPIRSRLTKGEAVTFEVDDGQGGKVERTVRPEDCVGPTEVAQSVLVLDVPTPAHILSVLASFSESPFFSQYRSKAEEVRKKHPVHAVFHLLGEGVLEDERYKEFMNGFSDETHHIVSSREHTPDKIVFTRSALVQARLNQLDADMFPLPKYNLTGTRDFGSVGGLPEKATLAYRDMIVNVRPPRPPKKDEKAKQDEFNDLASSNTLPELPDTTLEKFKEVQRHVNQRPGRGSPAAQPGDDVVLTPLGTGSAVPTRVRNVSGTLIQIPGRGGVLLDCGEGTWGQLARSFGDDPARTGGVWQVLRELKCIFLSHMHGDHHMGLSKILQMRTLMSPPPSEPLYLIGLRSHLMYLTERQELEDVGLSDPNGVVMILSDALNWRPPRPYGRNQPEDERWMNADTSRQNAQAMCRTLGLKSFQTVDVAHRTRCYGCVLRHENGWSVAFSADTMPTENLVRAGRDATLLIHESSMSPEEEQLAFDKAHSTSAQAIDIGRRMNAQKLLLTHFSARYPGMPPRKGGNGDGSAQPLVGIAFDYARIRLGDFWKLNAYLPAIQHAFDQLEDEDPMEIDLTKLQ